MSRAAFIENVAKKGNISKAESKRVVDLVLGEIEAGLKKSKKEGRYLVLRCLVLPEAVLPEAVLPTPFDRHRHWSCTQPRQTRAQQRQLLLTTCSCGTSFE